MAEKESANPLWLAVIALLIPQFMGVYQEHNKFKLEQAQFESNLIMRAVDPNDPKKTTEAITFLIKAGFISEGKALKALRDTSLRIPSYAESVLAPTSSPARFLDTREVFSGTIIDANTKRPLQGVTVAAKGTDLTEQMVTEKDGHFAIHYPGVAPYERFKRRYRPGSWTFSITRPGYTPFVRWEIGGMRFPANMVIELEPVDRETVADKLFD